MARPSAATKRPVGTPQARSLTRTQNVGNVRRRTRWPGAVPSWEAVSGSGYVDIAAGQSILLRRAIMGRREGIAAIVLVVLAGLLPAACSPPWSTTCTVGYAGNDLNITVEGVGADDACGQLEKQGPAHSTGTPGDVPAGSGYATSPTGTLVCQYTIRGLEYTVRDQGLIKLNGAVACSELSRRAGQTS